MLESYLQQHYLQQNEIIQSFLFQPN